MTIKNASRLATSGRQARGLPYEVKHGKRANREHLQRLAGWQSLPACLYLPTSHLIARMATPSQDELMPLANLQETPSAEAAERDVNEDAGRSMIDKEEKSGDEDAAGKKRKADEQPVIV